VFAKEGFAIMDHEPNPFFMKFETVAGEDWTGQKLDLTIWNDEISFLEWVSTALDALSYTLVGILMIIIAVGIMNAMWISVRERTNEIGTVRAIGMTRSRVLFMFLTEALMLGLFATSLGALLGAGVATALDAAQVKVGSDVVEAILMTDVLTLSASPCQVFSVIWVFTLITGLSALWPAFKASRLQPVTAIQHAR